MLLMIPVLSCLFISGASAAYGYYYPQSPMPQHHQQYQYSPWEGKNPYTPGRYLKHLGHRFLFGKHYYKQPYYDPEFYQQPSYDPGYYQQPHYDPGYYQQPHYEAEEHRHYLPHKLRKQEKKHEKRMGKMMKMFQMMSMMQSGGGKMGKFFMMYSMAPKWMQEMFSSNPYMLMSFMNSSNQQHPTMMNMGNMLYGGMNSGMYGNPEMTGGMGMMNQCHCPNLGGYAAQFNSLYQPGMASTFGSPLGAYQVPGCTPAQLQSLGILNPLFSPYTSSLNISAMNEACMPHLLNYMQVRAMRKRLRMLEDMDSDQLYNNRPSSLRERLFGGHSRKNGCYPGYGNDATAQQMEQMQHQLMMLQQQQQQQQQQYNNYNQYGNPPTARSRWSRR